MVFQWQCRSVFMAEPANVLSTQAVLRPGFDSDLRCYATRRFLVYTCSLSLSFSSYPVHKAEIKDCFYFRRKTCAVNVTILCPRCDESVVEPLLSVFVNSCFYFSIHYLNHPFNSLFSPLSSVLSWAASYWLEINSFFINGVMSKTHINAKQMFEM